MPAAGYVLAAGPVPASGSCLLLSLRRSGLGTGGCSWLDPIMYLLPFCTCFRTCP